MPKDLLSDARLRTASRERDGVFLPDGGGLRFRLLDPSSNHPKGARLAEFHFKLKRVDGTYLSTSVHLGTLGDSFNDDKGKTRSFTLADAREARNAARELVAQGIDPREHARLARAEKVEEQRRRLSELDTRRTVRQAFEKWRDLYLAAHRKDAGVFVQGMFERYVFPTVGELPLESLRRAQVTDLLDAITSTGKRRTANATLSALRQFMRWCVVRDWLTADPTLALSKAAFGGNLKPRERTLSVLEIVELRDKLPTAELHERLISALWLILATGCRVGELSGARVADFDIEGRTWLIPETKNGSPHLVHLSDFALGHVRHLIELRGESAFLLPGRDPDYPISVKVIAKHTGDRQRVKPFKGRTKAISALILARGNWTPHDLRRTMASRMRGSLKISSDVIERCLNHTPQGIVGVYQTDELMAERKAAFEAWGVELQRLMTLDASNVVELVRDGSARVAA